MSAAPSPFNLIMLPTDLVYYLSRHPKVRFLIWFWRQVSCANPFSSIILISYFAVGSAVVLVFGSQKDFLRAWVCHRESAPETVELPSSPEGSDQKSPGLYSGGSESSVQLEGGLNHDGRRFMLSLGRKTTPNMSPQYISRPILREDLSSASSAYYTVS